MRNIKLFMDISNDNPIWKKQFRFQSIIKQTYRIINFIFREVKERKRIGISLLLSNNEYLRTLNHKYRKKDIATNILAFPAKRYRIAEFNKEISDKKEFFFRQYGY